MTAFSTIAPASGTLRPLYRPKTPSFDMVLFRQSNAPLNSLLVVCKRTLSVSKGCSINFPKSPAIDPTDKSFLLDYLFNAYVTPWSDADTSDASSMGVRERERKSGGHPHIDTRPPYATYNSQPALTHINTCFTAPLIPHSSPFFNGFVLYQSLWP